MPSGRIPDVGCAARGRVGGLLSEAVCGQSGRVCPAAQGQAPEGSKEAHRLSLCRVQLSGGAGSHHCLKHRDLPRAGARLTTLRSEGGVCEELGGLCRPLGTSVHVRSQGPRLLTERWAGPKYLISSAI